MKELFINRLTKTQQLLFSMLLIGIVAGICYIFADAIGYRVVAFILLVTVSVIASSFDILPVFIAAVLTALVWNFFFIPPKFTLHVDSAEDVSMLIMYLVIALVNAALTYKIRQVEKLYLKKEEKANTIKLYNTLLNSLSHELRTPISTIIAATDNLQGNAGNLTPLDKNELVSEISTASFRLNQQVENLLNMSRLDSGVIQPKKDWVDINEMVYDVVQRIEQSDHFHHQIHININPDIPLFKTDKGMMDQVLYNLLNNAVLYTPVQKRIDIIATVYADMLELIVEDEGPGFPAEEIENVFDKFYRLKNSATGGTGLGLSIVRGFVEALGGKVSLQNKTAAGARFTIIVAGETSYLKNLKNE
jgi:two-component system sensor histidine kinase KdpD